MHKAGVRLGDNFSQRLVVVLPEIQLLSEIGQGYRVQAPHSYSKFEADVPIDYSLPFRLSTIMDWSQF